MPTCLLDQDLMPKDAPFSGHVSKQIMTELACQMAQAISSDETFASHSHLGQFQRCIEYGNLTLEHNQIFIFHELRAHDLAS